MFHIPDEPTYENLQPILLQELLPSRVFYPVFDLDIVQASGRYYPVPLMHEAVARLRGKSLPVRVHRGVTEDDFDRKLIGLARNLHIDYMGREIMAEIELYDTYRLLAPAIEFSMAGMGRVDEPGDTVLEFTITSIDAQAKPARPAVVTGDVTLRVGADLAGREPTNARHVFLH